MNYSFEFNDVYNCETALYEIGTPGLGCLNVDPNYINPVVDFHLNSSSLCINAGDPVILDVDASRSDMGVYGGPGGE